MVYIDKNITMGLTVATEIIMFCLVISEWAAAGLYPNATGVIFLLVWTSFMFITLMAMYPIAFYVWKSQFMFGGIIAATIVMNSVSLILCVVFGQLIVAGTNNGVSATVAFAALFFIVTFFLMFLLINARETFHGPNEKEAEAQQQPKEVSQQQNFENQSASGETTANTNDRV